MNKAENHEVVSITPWTMTFVKPCFSNKKVCTELVHPR